MILNWAHYQYLSVLHTVCSKEMILETFDIEYFCRSVTFCRIFGLFGTVFWALVQLWNLSCIRQVSYLPHQNHISVSVDASPLRNENMSVTLPKKTDSVQWWAALSAPALTLLVLAWKVLIVIFLKDQTTFSLSITVTRMTHMTTFIADVCC